MINRRPVYIQQYFIQKATAVIRFNSIAPMQDNYTQKGIYYLRERGVFSFYNDHQLKFYQTFGILIFCFKHANIFWIEWRKFNPKLQTNL